MDVGMVAGAGEASPLIGILGDSGSGTPFITTITGKAGEIAIWVTTVATWVRPISITGVIRDTA
jgi:hypothetical protein